MYRRKQVEQMTGLPARRIQFYTDQGLLPAVEKETGRGIERKYSKDDVVRIAIIKEMADLGLSLSTIKTFLVKEKVFYRNDQGVIDSFEYERISFEAFNNGLQLYFVYERLTDNSHMFVIISLIELQERLKRQFLIDEDETANDDDGVGGTHVKSEIVIDLYNIFAEIDWL